MGKIDLATALRDVGVALVLLTRLPVPRLPDAAFARQSRAAWAFPLAGLALALPACALGWAALALGLGAWGAAGLVLAVQVMLSGAMHEDGLADTADGLWGGRTRARRLEIMRDSHVGAFGVVALVLGLGLRWGALAALLEAGAFGAVIAVAMVSRAVLPALMAGLPPARADGLAHGVGRAGWGGAAAALALALAAGLALGGPAILIAALAGGVVAAALGRLALDRIGGQTGDILGAAQQSAEIAGLLAMQAALPG